MKELTPFAVSIADAVKIVGLGRTSLYAAIAAGLKVTAFEVNHDPIRPAVGYRFDWKGRSVVISGDTAYTQNLVENAKGADILVCESLAANLIAQIGRASCRERV